MSNNNNDIFTTGTYFKTKKDIKKTLENVVLPIVSDGDVEQKLDELSPEELSNLIYRFEKAALSCRKALTMKGLPSNLGMCGNNYDDLSIPSDLKLVSDKHGLYSSDTKTFYKPETWKTNYENLVRVSYKDNVLKVTTPATFKRFKIDNSLKENYVLMNYVQACLNSWASQNNIDLFHLIPSPCTALIIRKMTKFNRIKICDNDNMENGRIINTIFEALGYSDNALNMDLYSCFRLCNTEEECGMEFVIIPRNDVTNIIEKLTCFE